MIFDFVDAEVPAALSASTQTFNLPRLNRANELLSSNSPLLDQWRHALHSLAMLQLPVSQHVLLPIFIRLSVERGFVIAESQPSSLDELLVGITETPTMDLRWVPGWRCVVNADSPDLFHSWNSRIFEVFLAQLNSFRSSILTSAESLTFNEKMPVVCALEHHSKGDVPVAFYEAYPGLDGLQRDFVTAFNGLREAFRSHSSPDFYAFLTAMAKLDAWLRQFGSQPIGASSDWVERKEFFSHYCQSPLGGVTVTRIMEFIRQLLPAPIPRSLQSPATLNLCYYPWGKLALEVQDQISARISPIDIEESEVPHANTSALPSSETSTVIRLWPVFAACLAFSRDDAPSFDWSPQLSRNLLVELGIKLVALSRPRLLELLTFASEMNSDGSDSATFIPNRAYSPLELADPLGLVKVGRFFKLTFLNMSIHFTFCCCSA